jgi:hypothetical protein
MKELEIRRMRELIAKREEETRLKKLASAKSSVNIDTSGSLTPCDHVPSLKQEDVDVVMNPNSGERNGFGNYRNSESATPPPRSVSKSSNGFSPSTVINPVSDGVLTLDEDSNRIANDPLNQDPTATHRYQGESHIRDISLQLICDPFVHLLTHDLFVLSIVSLLAHTPCQCPSSGVVN